MRLTTLLLSLALTSLVSAQNLVIPAGLSLATTEGNSNSLTPGNPSVARIQFVYANSVLGSKARPITGFRFRGDGTYTNHRPWASFSALNFEVWLGDHPGPEQLDRYSHAGNRNVSHTQVVKPRSLVYPATPMPATAPDTFSVDIKFDKPFIFTNQHGLVVEMVRDDKAIAYYRWYMDAYKDPSAATAPQGSFSSFGTGCPFGFVATCHKVAISGATKSPEAPFPGQSFFTEGIAGRPNVPLLGILGTSDKTFSGLKLPFSLAPFGGYGCNLYTNWLVVVTGNTGTSSTGEFKLDWGKIPFDKTLQGATVYHQTAGMSPTYNALGLGLSQGLKITLGPGYSPGMVTACAYGNYYGSFPNYSVSDDVPQFWTTKGAILELY